MNKHERILEQDIPISHVFYLDHLNRKNPLKVESLTKAILGGQDVGRIRLTAHGYLLDGLHRLLATKAAGMNSIPVEFVLDEDLQSEMGAIDTRFMDTTTDELTRGDLLLQRRVIWYAMEWGRMTHSIATHRSFVYFIASLPGDFVKIGFSSRPWARLEQLQTATPYTLQLRTMSYGTKYTEEVLHLAFAKERIRGEWFRCLPGGELDTLIQDIIRQDKRGAR